MENNLYQTGRGDAMGDIIEEVLKNKEEFLIKILEILEGKEARTRINLDGVEFKIGKSKIKVNGNIEFVVIPFEKKR
jgi:hypothetical protein